MRPNHQFDLSAGVVRIDYRELVGTAQTAVFLAREELHQRLQKWYRLPSEEQPGNLDAEWMQSAAGRLAQATTTLCYLTGGLDREEVIITNKPEVKEKAA
ncbi:MAG: hypothetical protein V1737_03705 [Chloroflexota bacterium]